MVTMTSCLLAVVLLGGQLDGRLDAVEDDLLARCSSRGGSLPRRGSDRRGSSWFRSPLSACPSSLARRAFRKGRGDDGHHQQKKWEQVPLLMPPRCGRTGSASRAVSQMARPAAVPPHSTDRTGAGVARPVPPRRSAAPSGPAGRPTSASSCQPSRPSVTRVAEPSGSIRSTSIVQSPRRPASPTFTVLGPDAGRHVTPIIHSRGAKRLRGQRQDQAARRQGQPSAILPTSRPSKKFIGGQPRKPATKRFAGRSYSVERPADLLHPAPVEDDDAIAQRHGLDLIVGDIHHCRPKASLKQVQLAAHFVAQGRVEVAERLIEQEDRRPPHQRPPQRHPLLLPARQLRRPAVEQVGQAQQLGRFLHAVRPCPAPAAGTRPSASRQNEPPLRMPHAEGEVVGDAEVRVERRPLEDQRHVARPRRQVSRPRCRRCGCCRW